MLLPTVVVGIPVLLILKLRRKCTHQNLLSSRKEYRLLREAMPDLKQLFLVSQNQKLSGLKMESSYGKATVLNWNLMEIGLFSQ